MPSESLSHKTKQSNRNDRPKARKPVVSLTRPPSFVLPDKGKGKEVVKPKSEIISLIDQDEAKKELESKDDLLWVDRFEPQNEADLAVHKKKVDAVRHWLQEAFDESVSGRVKKYRRILVLTGLAGTGKTSTIRVLCREMGFKIEEWRHSQDDAYMNEDYERESHTEKFESFFKRVTKVQELRTSVSEPSSSRASSFFRLQRQIVLLEDLPNVLHQPTQAAFHTALEGFVAESPEFPVVIIISDASTRGDVRDEGLSQGGEYHRAKDSVDIRTVIPPSLLSSPYVTQISFNPVAPTLMTRALQAMLSKYHAETGIPNTRRISKEDLNIIVGTSNGDIRSATMALQFSCSLGINANLKPGKRKGGEGTTRPLMEAVTRRGQALTLFHLIGKILYNKRKGDPSGASSTAKDKHREQELDRRLIDPAALPDWLSGHHRRTSRVDIDTLYADSPVDTGLFSLYIQQNYTQFCNELEECEGVSDWLSWIDASGGEQWYQTNPHQFHLLTLGTLHSLPSPVPRRAQKMYKPEFFDALKRQRAAEDEGEDARRWLGECSLRNYTKNEIYLELGAVLKGLSQSSTKAKPPTHSAFSSMIFSRTDGRDRILEDDETFDESFGSLEGELKEMEKKGEIAVGTWLESDDIEES